MIDSVQAGQYGKLLGWLLLSGLFDSVEQPDLEPAVEAIGRWRESLSGATSDKERRRERLMLFHLAVTSVGEAVAGETFAARLGLGWSDAGCESYRDWLAESIAREFLSESD